MSIYEQCPLEVQAALRVEVSNRAIKILQNYDAEHFMLKIRINPLMIRFQHVLC